MATPAPGKDTSTRQALIDALSEAEAAAALAIMRLSNGSDSADLVPDTRRLRSAAQEAATQAAYARSLRATPEERRG